MPKRMCASSLCLLVALQGVGALRTGPRPPLRMPITGALAPLAAALPAALTPLPAHAAEGFGALLETEEAKQLGVFFAQTVISWGVPGAVALVLVIAASGGRSSSPDDDDLPPVLAKALGMGAKEPKEYLKVERLNAKFDSFDYSLTKAVVSKDSALRDAERTVLERRFGAEVAAMGLSSDEVQAIGKAEEKFRKADAKIGKRLEAKTRQLRARSLSKSKKTKAGGADGGKADADGDDSGGPLGAMMASLGGGGLDKEVLKLQQAKMAAELSFLSSLSATLSAEQAATLAAAIKPAGAIGADDVGGGGPTAVAQLASAAAAARSDSKHVYVLSFFGDVTASQVANLRQEITAVLRTAKPARGDKVVLVLNTENNPDPNPNPNPNLNPNTNKVVLILNTGGGTVTGYGLAAAQLSRLSPAGVHLTVCVEQVEA